MSSVSELSSLSDQAIKWVILLHSGTATPQDRLMARRWQHKSPAHEKAYAEAEQLWHDMGIVLQQHPPGFADTLDDQPPITQAFLNKAANEAFPAPRQRLPLVWASLAAVILITVLSTPLNRLGDRYLSDYHTAIGEQKQLNLSDGSHIILNTDTALSVDWNQHHRRITLLRGQAQFTVRPDTQRPFEVVTETAVITALGTIFEVQTTAQDTLVTVLEHAVAITPPTADNHSPRARLNAGQQAQYHPNRGLYAIQSIDSRQSTAWQRGKLILKNQPLAAVITDLNRYFPGKIVLTDPRLPQLRVSGVFPINNTDAVLTLLETSLPLKIHHLGPWLTLISQRPPARR